MSVEKATLRLASDLEKLQCSASSRLWTDHRFDHQRSNQCPAVLVTLQKAPSQHLEPHGAVVQWEVMQAADRAVVGGRLTDKQKEVMELDWVQSPVARRGFWVGLWVGTQALASMGGQCRAHPT